MRKHALKPGAFGGDTDERVAQLHDGKAATAWNFDGPSIAHETGASKEARNAMRRQLPAQRR